MNTHPDRRAHLRIECPVEIIVRMNGEERKAMVQNISESGLSLQPSHDLSCHAGDVLTLQALGGADAPALTVTVVRVTAESIAVSFVSTPER